MYLGFLSRIPEADLTRDDWPLFAPRAGRIIGMMKTREHLEKLLDTFPELREKINENPEGWLYDAVNGRSMILLSMLKEKLPPDFDLWKYSEANNFSLVHSAIIGGNKELVQELAPLLSAQVVTSLVTSKTRKDIHSRFLWHLGFDGERSAAALESLEMIVDSIPQRLQPRFICHNHFYALEGAFVHNDQRLALKFIDLLPKGAVANFIESPSISMFMHDFGKSDHSPILQALVDKLGPEQFAESMLQKRRGFHARKENNLYPSQHLPSHYGTTIGTLLYSDGWEAKNEEMRTILAAFPQSVADALISENHFHVLRSDFLGDRSERFRMLYNRLSPDLREAVFKDEGVENTLKYVGGMHGDVTFHALKDLLPPHYMEFIGDKRIVPNAKQQDAWEVHFERRREKILPSLHDSRLRLPAHDALDKDLYERLLPLCATAQQLEGFHTSPEGSAAKLAILFDSFKQADRYMGRVARGYGGQPPKQPLHDGVEYEIPKEGEWDIAHWRRQVMDYGPAASRFLGLAPKIEQKAMELGRDKPKKPAGILEIASLVAYARQHEQPEFAKLALTKGCSENQFDRCLDILQGNPVTSKKYGHEKDLQISLKKSDTLPALFIDGNEIGLPSYYMVKLEISNPNEAAMATILGKLSHCCQSVGSEGEKYTLHGLTSEKGGFYVWKKKLNGQEDQFVAQSWAWISERNAICFDSIEPLGSAHDRIFPAFMERFLERAAEEFHFSGVTVGTGGKTPVNLKEKYALQNPPEKPADWAYGENENAMHDSKQQYLIARSAKQGPDSASR